MKDLLWADWGRHVAGAGIILALLFGLRMILKASDWSIGTYRDAGRFDANRVAELETKVRELNAKVDSLTADYREQRQRKHDWRSFASSLVQERFVIREFAQLHDCAEIVALMSRLDDMRRSNPLMAEVQSMTSMEDHP